MTPETWRAVRDCFERLVELDLIDATARLEAEVSDPAVRAEVRSLLEHHSRAGSFLLEPPDLSPFRHRRLMPGAILGPYAVVRDVGSGGMGDIYLATDTRLERPVCLKAVRHDLAADPRYRDRLRTEARLAAALNHPGLCAVHALEEFDGELYLVTEFVDGQTIRTEISGPARPTVSQVQTTMHALAEALDAAHVKGVVHRDLKPENVMRTRDGRLKILDFGLARAESDRAAHSTSSVAGTLAYMAPEQINGEPTDARTDLFALGVLAYEYATGTHPFVAPSALAMVARILEHKPQPLGMQRPDLPHHIVATIMRCLEKAPADRIESARAIIDGLEDIGPKVVRRPEGRTWWRVHQLVVIAVYLVGCGLTWQVAQWEPGMVSRLVFLLTGLLAATAGVVRGHLLFTERTNSPRLPLEHRRVRRPLAGLDLTTATSLVVAAALASTVRPVAAALALGLAAGIALAAILIEPATTTAALNDHVS